MLSKNKIKLIRSLDQKKNRIAEGLFLAEGKKMILDLIKSKIIPVEIFCTEEIANEISAVDQKIISVIKKNELEKVSFLKSTPDIIALFRIPDNRIDWTEIQEGLTLALDSLQDPGNLGTIIRTADWFGIKNIVCSLDTVDVFNPKTVQSTMGALGRVKVHYLDLRNFYAEARRVHLPIYGTFMEGENLYQTELTAAGIIIMGNEGKGISGDSEEFISKRISIPPYPGLNNRPESLNVAVAASIICSEFRRRLMR